MKAYGNFDENHQDNKNTCWIDEGNMLVILSMVQDVAIDLIVADLEDMKGI